MKIYRQDGSVDYYEDEIIDEEVIETQPSSEEIKAQKLAEIEALQIELAKSDYMVIKDWEAEKLGLPLPYSAEEIHAIKQPLRDRINELEKEIGL